MKALRLTPTAIVTACLIYCAVNSVSGGTLSDEAARLVRPLTETDRKPVPIKNPDAALKHALAFQKTKQFKKAAAMYSRPDVDKSSCAVQLNLGLCYEQLERWADAEASFLGAAQLSPQDPRAYKHLANVCLKLGKDQEAIDCWRKYLTLLP